jgi:hypothetical protein
MFSENASLAISQRRVKSLLPLDVFRQCLELIEGKVVEVPAGHSW